MYGKLEDKFGDNGVVTVLIGHEESENVERHALHLDLWLMSCRVLKRDMEYAMMDVLVEKCVERGIRTIYGYYYPTAKNGMVRDFYGLQGFEKIRENEKETVWRFEIPENYEKKNHYIETLK